MLRALITLLLGLSLARPGMAEPLSVHMVKADLAPASGQVVFTGVLQAIKEFPVAFPQGGRVISLAVREGDQVAEGQELARQDPTQADAALRAASASLGGAEAALREAHQASDRAEELLARGAGTRADLDAATQVLLAARSSRDQAEAQLSKARKAQSNTVLHAPAAGVVTTHGVEPGQIVNPGQTVVEMAQEGGMEAVFNAPDGADLEAFLGKTLTLSPVDTPDAVLHALLSQISPMVDATTGAVRVKAKVTEAVPDGVVIGSSVIGRLDMSYGTAITLPWTALTEAAGQPAVWVVDRATMAVHQVPVTVAAYGADTVRLASGLEPGSLVVTDGAQLLFPGRVVVDAGGTQ
jgi:RND family efflux transporter MFP subunit